MKKITQTLQYDDDQRYELTNNLSDWHKQHPLADNGVDFEFQYLWATMTDEDCLAFCLLHPQWSHRFTTI
jgi:hypothetical protein